MITVTDADNDPVADLACPCAEVLARIEQSIDPTWSRWIAARAWPGASAVGLTAPTAFRPWPPCPLRINTMHWPTGASRYGFGAFLCDTEDIEAIRDAAFGEDRDANNPLNLTIDGEDVTGKASESVTFSVYLLPPSPLFRLPDPDSDDPDSEALGCYLLFFVDARYFWAYQPTPDFGVNNQTRWTDLYAACATALGITLTPDAIPAHHFQPHPEWNRYANVPIGQVLDALAANVGQVIVASYDGSTFRALNFDSSNTILSATLAAEAAAGRTRQAGGYRDPSDDLPNILPAEAQVAFPASDCAGTPIFSQTAYVSTVELADLELDEVPADLVGAPGTKCFLDKARALWARPASGDPTNQANLDDLAEQIATDYYDFQSVSFDIVYDGALDWALEGLTDCITWTYTSEALTTRVVSRPFDGYPQEFLHETWDVNFPPRPPTFGVIVKTPSGGIDAATSGPCAVQDFSTGALVLTSCEVPVENLATSGPTPGTVTAVAILIDDHYIGIWEDCPSN